MKIEVSKKQMEFMEADADEVLFGGAAGGGKSYGQLVDSLLYAFKYKKSKQLILRRTFPDMERSLVLTSLELFPQQYAKYNSSKHKWIFANGSLIEFGYCDSEKDVYRYQGAEYDTIRFDELTHFTEQMYIYLISRLRGTNNYPKQIKSSTNPGGVGHNWVKNRFIDIGSPNKKYKLKTGTRQFIQSFVQDNKFLIMSDPNYVKRLENLGEKDKKALLYGDWDIFEGQFFTEFKREIHVTKPFKISEEWRRYVSFDYGLDMLAAFWIAVDSQNNAYVYDELYESNLIISNAAKKILEQSQNQKIYAFLAPPDLWNRRQETGKSAADIFFDNGLHLTKTGNNRVDGWFAVKEWLKIDSDEQGILTSKLKIFDSCKNLIRTLPSVQTDKLNPNDVANSPHELTHAPDALRGFCIYKVKGNNTNCNNQQTVEEIFKINRNKINSSKGGKINVI
ncbi:MAG: phage terminase large subunit [Oscillospiraceae bacterium]